MSDPNDESQLPATLRIRRFWPDGSVQYVADVAADLAQDLIADGKAELAPDAPDLTPEELHDAWASFNEATSSDPYDLAVPDSVAYTELRGDQYVRVSRPLTEDEREPLIEAYRQRLLAELRVLPGYVAEPTGRGREIKALRAAIAEAQDELAWLEIEIIRRRGYPAFETSSFAEQVAKLTNDLMAAPCRPRKRGKGRPPKKISRREFMARLSKLYKRYRPLKKWLNEVEQLKAAKQLSDKGALQEKFALDHPAMGQWRFNKNYEAIRKKLRRARKILKG